MIARRLRALLLVLLGVCTLAGCSIEGRVELVSPSVVNLDVTVRGERSPYCNGDIAGVTVTPGNEPGGIVSSCRYVGTVNPLTLEGAYVAVATAGEYTAVVLNPYADGQISNEVESLAVTLVLPGDLVEHSSGVAVGRELRLTDPTVFDVPGGLRVVALNHAGPPYWLWWTGGGLVLGLLAGLATAALIRRRSPRHGGRTADQPNGSDDPDAADHVPVTAPAQGWDGADPGDTAHDSSAAPSSSDDARPGAGDDPAPEPSLWARPEPRPAPTNTDTSDPSRWAPPG